MNSYNKLVEACNVATQKRIELLNQLGWEFVNLQIAHDRFSATGAGLDEVSRKIIDITRYLQYTEAMNNHIMILHAAFVHAHIQMRATVYAFHLQHQCGRAKKFIELIDSLMLLLGTCAKPQPYCVDHIRKFVALIQDQLGKSKPVAAFIRAATTSVSAELARSPLSVYIRPLTVVKMNEFMSSRANGVTDANGPIATSTLASTPV